MVTRSCPLLLERKYRVTGVAVLDIVEGNPINSFCYLDSY